MIDGALLHLPGIGPEKRRALYQRGIHTWSDLLDEEESGLPGLAAASPLAEAIHESRRAAGNGDIGWMVRRFHRADHWRILDRYHREATFIDIETDGLEADSRITLIICFNGDGIRTYVQGRNLDDVLDELDRTRLFVSFNGASFDLPRIENAFRIPPISIPHIDLRWVMTHAGFQGGLKSIEKKLGITRPRDLVGSDGAEAVWLWNRWKETGNPELLTKLIRYCAADVVTLRILAENIAGIVDGTPPQGFDNHPLWQLLPEEPDIRPPVPVQNQVLHPAEAETGTDPAEERLRRHHRRRKAQG